MFLFRNAFIARKGDFIFLSSYAHFVSSIATSWLIEMQHMVIIYDWSSVGINAPQGSSPSYTCAKCIRIETYKNEIFFWIKMNIAD